MTQPALIAPFSAGLDTDTEPWMSPADSFSEADNVHIYNGFVEKRSGYSLFGQMKTLNATVNISGITQAANGVVTTSANHNLATYDKVFIKSVAGMTQVNNLYFTVTVLTPTTFQLNVNTSAYGAYTSGGTMAKVIDSTDRVMGIHQFLKNDGTKATLAFSTKRANIYDTASKSFLPLDSANIMNGSTTNYVWGVNLQSSTLPNRLYFTNGKAYTGSTDGIRYYDGSGYTTTSFTPSLGGGRTLYGAGLLFCLQERLIALDTFIESGGVVTNNKQEARWCQAQGVSNWNDIVPGGGGYTDAPTGDQIVSARALKDLIIVFFTNSIWALQPVPDPALPFKWVKLNDFRACDGKMASVGYDGYVMSLGIRGISATFGSETQRIDKRISDFCTDNINVDVFDKVFAERSFTERRTWILYPSVENDENTSALILDEDSQAYTTYTIALNCLGHGSAPLDMTLADFTAANGLDLAIEDFGEETLQSYFWQGFNEFLLGGSITGSVYKLETEAADAGASIESTMTTAGWNPFHSSGAQAVMSYLDIYVDTHPKTRAKIEFFKDDATAPYAEQIIDFLPNLDYVASIQDIWRIAPTGVVIAANHGLSTGDVIYIYGVDGMDAVNGGPYTITLIDEDSFGIGIDTSAFTAYSTGGGIYRKPFYKTKTWKRAYAGGTGYLHKVRVSSEGANCPFRISGFKPLFKPAGNRVVN